MTDKVVSSPEDEYGNRVDFVFDEEGGVMIEYYHEGGIDAVYLDVNEYELLINEYANYNLGE